MILANSRKAAQIPVVPAGPRQLLSRLGEGRGSGLPRSRLLIAPAVGHVGLRSGEHQLVVSTDLPLVDDFQLRNLRWVRLEGTRVLLFFNFWRDAILNALGFVSSASWVRLLFYLRIARHGVCGSLAPFIKRGFRLWIWICNKGLGWWEIKEWWRRGCRGYRETIFFGTEFETVFGRMRHRLILCFICLNVIFETCFVFNIVFCIAWLAIILRIEWAIVLTLDIFVKLATPFYMFWSTLHSTETKFNIFPSF